MKIVGIMGKAGVGKDTMADYLVGGFNFVKIGMADPLKRICREVFDFSEQQLWGPSAERNRPDYRYLRGKHLDEDEMVPQYLTPRLALQTLGTEWGRAMYENVWVDHAIRSAKKVLEGEWNYTQREGLTGHAKFTGVVIPDVRFINEVEAIVTAGGIVVRIKREIKTMTAGIVGHASEAEQDSVRDEDLNGGVIEAPEGKLAYAAAIDEWMKKVGLDT